MLQTSSMLQLVADNSLCCLLSASMQGSSAAAVDASLNGSSSSNGACTKRRGLLEAAMIPGLKDVDGDIAKLKHDLAVRADDITASSDAYRYVLQFS
jgi:hypothetical protein